MPSRLYDTREGVEEYLELTDGLDGATHVRRLERLVPEGARVLELGSGPGRDLEILSRCFQATGSDPSTAFRTLAEERTGEHPLDLDAVTISLPPGTAPFEALFSNKVLHHLQPTDHERSVRRQLEVLAPGGVVVHTYPHGAGSERERGLFFRRFQPQELELEWAAFDVLAVEPVSELDWHDTLRLVARRPR